MIDAPESDYLYKRQSQIPDSGIGLFTAIDIYKHETIAIFKGEILTALQAKNRAKEGNDKYFINLPVGNIMDSMHVRCFAKYANDARGLPHSTFKNNARITLDDNDDVCLIAIRNIQANEELFCSYGKRYWKKHS
jgi:SET domain-containing protein